MSPRSPLLLLASLALAATACGTPKINAADVLLLESKDKGTSVCVNAEQRVTVQALLKDGERRTTAVDADRGDRFDASILSWKASHGAITSDEDGVRWSPPRDLSGLLEHDVNLKVVLVGHEAIQTSFDLVPSFGCGSYAAYGGRGGMNGPQGEPGSSQSDADSPVPGNRGGDGGNGGPAEAGPDVEVRIAPLDTQKRGRLAIVMTGVVGASEQTVFIVDPRGKPFTLSARGGQGGRGGDGGAGGNGARLRGDCGTGGRGGDGGRGGSGGDGGRGSRVRVLYDASAPELANIVAIDNSGGNGGDGGSGGPGGTGAGVTGSGYRQTGNGSSESCASSADGGTGGPGGEYGGKAGADGPPPELVAMPLDQVFPNGLPVTARP